MSMVACYGTYGRKSIFPLEIGTHTPTPQIIYAMKDPTLVEFKRQLVRRTPGCFKPRFILHRTRIYTCNRSNSILRPHVGILSLVLSRNRGTTETEQQRKMMTEMRMTTTTTMVMTMIKTVMMPYQERSPNSTPKSSAMFVAFSFAFALALAVALTPTGDCGSDVSHAATSP